MRALFNDTFKNTRTPARGKFSREGCFLGGVLGAQHGSGGLGQELVDRGRVAIAVRAERSLLAGLGGGCNVPLAAFAEQRREGGLRLRALVARRDGA